MNPQNRIWTCASFLPAYGCGGWASVRIISDQVTGLAGGERNTTASRLALQGLLAGLRDLPPVGRSAASAKVNIQTTSPELAEFAALLATLGQPAETEIELPDEDLDLWTSILAASQRRRLILTHTTPVVGTPNAFTTAWAEFARDKVKSRGPFSAPIPKANLDKFPGAPGST